MKRAVFFGVALAALRASVPSNAVADDLTVVKGQCTPRSHIAEGAIGEDLTKHESQTVLTYLTLTPSALLWMPFAKPFRAFDAARISAGKGSLNIRAITVYKGMRYKYLGIRDASFLSSPAVSSITSRCPMPGFKISLLRSISECEIIPIVVFKSRTGSRTNLRAI